MSRFDPRQTRILRQRYLEVLTSDFAGLLLAFVQAPLLAGAIAGVYANVEQDAPTLYFVLCLSIFFLGAVNAARELVKERPLFLREKMVNLSAGSYLVSKYQVQLVFVLIQAILLTGVVAGFIRLRVSLIVVLLTLVGVGAAGMAAGLLISAFARSADKAVGAVPLVVIPQILFSDVVLGAGQLKNWTGYAAALMPVEWGYELLLELRKAEVGFGTVFGALAVVQLEIGVAFLLTWFLLERESFE